MDGIGDGANPASASFDTATCPGYRRRKPERTLLYATVRAHLKTFLAEMEGEAGASLPRFVVGDDQIAGGADLSG